MDTNITQEIAAGALADCKRTYRRFANWHAAVDRSIALKDGGASLARKRPPSKESKHRMYAAAGRVIRILDLDVERPCTLDGIAAVIAAAEGRP